jgi:2-amino-4-hydroxy-6-hydroxymethyldihydropteridine diphosphokinase
MSSLQYVIGMGSNLGDRREQLRASARAIGGFAIIEAASTLYENDALGPPQPRFLNAALLVQSGLAPIELLRALLEVERRLGRVRGERWGPRLIDLDILWSPGLVVSTPELVVPHPELENRAFALVPLLEVAAFATEPRSGRSYRDTLERQSAAGLAPIPDSESGRWLG